MKPETISLLLQINKCFYNQHAEHFSHTRASAWKGWTRCVKYVECMTHSVDECYVLDVACGNLRFESFLQESLPKVRFSYTALDNCLALARDYMHEQASVANISFVCSDVIAALQAGEKLLDGVPQNVECMYDVAVSFGFMHHIPTMQLRMRLLDELIASVRSGGYVMVSFWEFMNHPGMAQKAHETHTQALCDMPIDADDLEDNDYFIGWNNQSGAYRYCHSFTSEEIDRIVRSFENCACVIDRFFADGRTDDLNEYVVLRVL